MTLRQLHGLRYQPSPSGVCISLLVMGQDINYDPDYRGTLSSSPGLDVTVTPGASTGHSDWVSPCSGIALGHQHRMCGSPDPRHPHSLR